MSDEVRVQVENTILKLENAVQNQTQLDHLWADIKNLLMKELDSLPELPKSTNKKQNKHFKKSQPFWNENLATAWAEVCKTEKEYLSFKARKSANLAHKNDLRNAHQNAQRTFDSKF